MVVVIVVAALAVLALVTQAGVFLSERAHPAQGRMVEVAGGTLHVLDIGPRDAAGPPIVMLHGASSNLEVMRQPVGERLARKHRVILIDRPGHGWSTRARLEDSTPEIQARMIEEALAKLGVNSAIFVVHSWAGALGARIALDYPQAVAGLVMLAPVAYPWPGGVGRYNRLIATPVIGPLFAYTVTLPLGLLLAEPGARGVFLPQTMPDGFVKNTATPLLLRPREFIANARDLVTLKAAVAEQAPRYARDQGAGHHHHRRRRQDGVDQHPLTAVRGYRAERKTDRAAGRRPHDPAGRARSRHCGSGGDDIRDGAGCGSGGGPLRRAGAGFYPTRVLARSRTTVTPHVA